MNSCDTPGGEVQWICHIFKPWRFLLKIALDFSVSTLIPSNRHRTNQRSGVPWHIYIYQFLHVLVFDNGCTRSIIIWASPILLLPTLFAGWNTSYFYFLTWFSEVNEEKHHVNEGNSCQIRWMIDRIKTKCSPRWRIVWRWLLHFKFLFDRCYSSDLFLMWWCGFLKFNRSQFSSTLAWWVN